MSNNGMTSVPSRDTRNIFLSGVGGQGTILASNILGQILLNAGYDVKKAEVHGMAQRGGDVTTHFRYGKKVYSPLIKEGEADYLVSFELLEALRYINWVKPGGKVVLIGIPLEDRTAFTASMARRKDLTVIVLHRMKHTYPRAIQLVTGGQVDVASLVTQRFPLADIVSAYAAAEKREGIKTVVDC